MDFKIKKGDKCLTCRARARSIVMIKAVRTWHGRSVEGGQAGDFVGASGHLSVGFGQ